jgi:hypothetical protein
MAIYRKIIKISKEDYDRIKKDYSSILDLYISDNTHYIIATSEELKALDLNPDVPFY